MEGSGHTGETVGRTILGWSWAHNREGGQAKLWMVLGTQQRGWVRQSLEGSGHTAERQAGQSIEDSGHSSLESPQVLAESGSHRKRIYKVWKKGSIGENKHAPGRVISIKCLVHFRFTAL